MGPRIPMFPWVCPGFSRGPSTVSLAYAGPMFGVTPGFPGLPQVSPGFHGTPQHSSAKTRGR
eukprot:12906059-Prorocentrum_lima.AAC.1